MFNRMMGRQSEPAQPSANAAPGAGQPLELVRYDEKTKRFEVGEEALKMLQSVRAPLGVVSVCGRARQGKSFILNQLLGRSSGFVVAPTHRPCTKGLWMWSSPVQRVGPDGSKHYLVCSRCALSLTTWRSRFSAFGVEPGISSSSSLSLAMHACLCCQRQCVSKI